MGCGCIPNYENVPLPDNAVSTITVMCDHGMSETSEISGYTVIKVLEYAASRWLKESPDDRLHGFAFDMGMDSEWMIRLTDTGGPIMVWNRCPDAEQLISEHIVSWSFHSEIPLPEWFFAFTLGATVIAVLPDEDPDL